MSFARKLERAQRRFHAHNAVFQTPHRIIGMQSAAQVDDHSRSGWCKLCDKAVDRESIDDMGGKRFVIRVECEGETPLQRSIHQAYGQTVDAIEVYWDSDSETHQDYLRKAYEKPFFDLGPLPTARTFYAPDAGAKSE